MTEWPSSATRQSRKCSAEQGRGHPCSQPRLSWQGLGLILMQINLCMSCQCLRQKKRAETASSHTWVQGATTSQLRHCWVLLLTLHLRNSPCSPAAGDRKSYFPCRHFTRSIFVILPYKGKSQSCWAGPLPSFAARDFHRKSWQCKWLQQRLFSWP